MTETAAESLLVLLDTGQLRKGFNLIFKQVMRKMKSVYFAKGVHSDFVSPENKLGKGYGRKEYIN